jgi:chromosome segregation ATPase
MNIIKMRKIYINKIDKQLTDTINKLNLLNEVNISLIDHYNNIKQSYYNLNIKYKGISGGGEGEVGTIIPDDDDDDNNNEEYKAREQKLSELKRKSMAIINDPDSLLNRINEMNSKLTTYMSSSTRLEGELNEMMRLKNVLEGKLNDMTQFKAAAEADLNDLRAEHGRLLDILGRSTDSTVSILDAATATKKELDDANEKRIQNEAQIIKLNNRLKAETKHVGDLQADVVVLQDLLEEAKAAIRNAA